MVQLSLSSPTGTGARYFPHAGFLALTPLKLEGIVRTRLDDDRKPLRASDLTVAVRCYEARLGRAGVAHSNTLVDFRTTLWAKQPHEPWSELGDGDWPFRLVLDPSLAGHSTASFQEYRVFWRIEAVLNHVPMLGVGHRQVKTYDLPLVRFDAGTALPPQPTTWCTAGPGLDPDLHYTLTTPPHPLGPLDLVPIALQLRPADPAARVHALALAIERRLEFVSGEPPLSSTTDLLERRAPPPKTGTTLVTSAEVRDIPRADDGSFARTVTLQVPAPKSGHWAIGETMRTALVSLSFFLRVKVTLCTPRGTQTHDLAPRELVLIAANESQRRVALAKYAAAASRRAKPPSPPSPPPSPLTPLTAASAHAPGSPKTKPLRRPHTSGGREAAASSRSAARRAAQSFRAARPARPGSGSGSGSSEEQPEHVRAWEDELERIEARSHWRTMAETPVMRAVPALQIFFAPGRAGTGGPPPPSPPASAREGVREESVQAWEEELERIAAASRRRSVDMLRTRRRTSDP